MAGSGADETFLHDIQFLIANDAQLTQDLSHLCAILEGSSSDSEQSAASSAKRKEAPPSDDEPLPRKPKNRFQHRQRQEILALRDEVRLLQGEMAKTRRGRPAPTPSRWEAIAKEERQAKAAVLHENEQLKAAVAHQDTFIETMQRLLRKKPRLELLRDPSSEAWKAYTLAAQASLRISAIHAIADRQYHRLRSTFLRLGLLDRPADAAKLVRITPTPQPNGTLVVEYIYDFVLPAPYEAVGEAVWSVFNGANAASCPVDATQHLEIIDDATNYETFARPIANATTVAYSNRITKRFREEDRDVVVWRTVLQDERMPHMTQGSVEDECGWLVVAAMTHETCRLSFVLSVVAGCTSIETVTRGIEAFAFGHLAESGSSPLVETPPSTTMVALMDKGKRFEVALRMAVAKAIAAHQTAASLSSERRVDSEFI
ncbi:hypothetical protein SDRG_04947 [Saprolegnia diclina VS20]|uniref:START domain-containing protein n=1 Tax=Saprolegnia diclina (strain VS20) TaxID=1156394 RepID=T0QV94_SAPDV|nr:hypothetical protein SDRG_04947 [Saprolegnia diclina VS20]EQC37930.1 hypothetical protein SDRG_04947 [Saprolegnia diclina VS20]|eukprot:XP_008608863.1 hypothetical protein SDRG_04947 [Saprolegnia diclina VS20]